MGKQEFMLLVHLLVYLFALTKLSISNPHGLLVFHSMIKHFIHFDRKHSFPNVLIGLNAPYSMLTKMNDCMNRT